MEARTVKLTAIATGIGFPDAQLALRVQRRSRKNNSRRRPRETVYAITDLILEQTTVAGLADALRAHWAIENRLH